MKNARRRTLSTVPAAVFGAGILLLGGVAQAAPAPESPIGGGGAHTHHVHTGDGGCVDIDAVAFEPAHRGLHRGATEGEVHHGTCATGQH